MWINGVTMQGAKVSLNMKNIQYVVEGIDGIAIVVMINGQIELKTPYSKLKELMFDK